ncbi:similar to DNA-3-methyladenine glycosylase [Plenodomus lingam JN3]|uniref:Similar to DNA-3-methyladenine glycosylase n=1 Tax=Leptosphaeria maculans (strain JN3 / isolate v23.1.3 / race Av1-4-5-6-7-8) TaxID=985895 RepID=E5R4U5_LEPMJ|nr:similar to DNA-3-methyladenine glycosylase [Plenodomus lingam JN3]CBX92218.1 similar to DNA-3-methyladenine glycosylase [Plenodomus lingam JN3]
MSLRRSARVASTTKPSPSDPESKNVAAKYKQADKPVAPPKKRKGKLLRSSPPQVPQTQTSEPLNETRATNGSPTKPPPPFTLTPSGATLLRPDPALTTLPTSTRPAEPHVTNATLSTPNGSHVVAYRSSPIKSDDTSPTKRRKAREVVPPDVGALPAASTNVQQLLKDAEAHLIRTDERLRVLVEKHRCEMFSPEGLKEVIDPFTELSKGIIGQQVSGQAATSIRQKFTSLFPTTHPSFPSPSQVLALDLPTLRTAGLSQRKAEYIHGLAGKFASGELSAAMLVGASDEELVERLVAVRGLGRWSVEMFACFGLKRMDVFSTGDLGVQQGAHSGAGKGERTDWIRG